METQKEPSLDELTKVRIQQAVASILVKLKKIDGKKGYTPEQLEYIFDIRISENLLSYLENKSKWVKNEQGNYQLVEIYKPSKEPQITKTKSGKNLAQKAKQELKAKNEGPGRYLNLNKFESDLLDYLKSCFNEVKFTADDIKFPNARVKGRRLMFEHLTYLTNNNYLERLPTVYERNKYYHYYQLAKKLVASK